MDGRELIAALGRRGSEVPVVVLSAAVAQPTNPTRSRNVTGAVATLDKPFSVEALLEVVERHASGASDAS